MLIMMNFMQPSLLYYNKKVKRGPHYKTVLDRSPPSNTKVKNEWSYTSRDFTFRTAENRKDKTRQYNCVIILVWWVKIKE